MELTQTRSQSGIASFFAQVKEKTTTLRRDLSRKVNPLPQTPQEMEYALSLWWLKACYSLALLGIICKAARPNDAFWERYIEYCLIYMAGRFGLSKAQSKPPEPQEKPHGA